MAGKIKVKTSFEPQYVRPDEITEYETDEKADEFISRCLKWGIGIVSCEIVDKPQQI